MLHASHTGTQPSFPDFVLATSSFSVDVDLPALKEHLRGWLVADLWAQHCGPIKQREEGCRLRSELVEAMSPQAVRLELEQRGVSADDVINVAMRQQLQFELEQAVEEDMLLQEKNAKRGGA